MKILLALLLVIIANPLYAVNAKYKSNNDGFNGNLVPHAILFSTYTQAITDTAEVQYIVLNSTWDFHGFTTVNYATFTVIDPRCYMFSFSGIADNSTNPAGTYGEIWLRHNDIPIANSNTRFQIPSSNVEMTVAVIWIEDMAAGDTFSLMTWGSATTVNWKYTAVGTNPMRPATPSIILSVVKVSGIWFPN